VYTFAKLNVKLIPSIYKNNCNCLTINNNNVQTATAVLLLGGNQSKHAKLGTSLALLKLKTDKINDA